MIHIPLIAALLGYAVVVSQPLFYIVALGHAQRALSAPAYIELRQHINSVMSSRVPVIYLSTLVAVAVSLLLSLSDWSGIVLITTGIALLCLVIDIIFMVRENVPINTVIDGWSTTSYPEDWEHYRAQWFAIFTYRQVVLLIGFLSLLVGAVFRA
jgi:hypothetical protein